MYTVVSLGTRSNCTLCSLSPSASNDTLSGRGSSNVAVLPSALRDGVIA